MNAQDTKPGQPKAAPAARLALNGKTVEMPVRSGVIGPDVIDVAHLYKETGCFTYDPGFTSTANCEIGRAHV